MCRRERGKLMTRPPPKGGRDDYDSENSWISGGLPSSSRRRRRGEGRGVENIKIEGECDRS